jgi:hypothetical protein
MSSDMYLCYLYFLHEILSLYLFSLNLKYMFLTPTDKFQILRNYDTTTHSSIRP